MKMRIFTPGPTPLPEEVKISQVREIIHHRTSEFSKVFAEVQDGLKYIFQSQNEVLILAASGTGAMEATVVNLLSSHDKVLVIQGGKFGERWTEINRTFGLEVVVLKVEWGKVAGAEEIGDILKQNPEIKAVFAQLVETSTGVVYDIKSIAEVVKETSAILIVDAISGLGAESLPQDQWAVDVVIGGSQKALMIPPGLAFVSLSEKARELMESSTLPCYYWDFKKAIKSLSTGQTPYTPAVSLICALRESLKIIRKEGQEKIIRRHSLLAQATRAAANSLGLRVFGFPPSNVVTAMVIPEEIGANRLKKLMWEKYGVLTAGGQAHLAGKIIRIAHLGWMDNLDILGAISALEMSLGQLGYSVKLGSGIKAAEEILSKE